MSVVRVLLIEDDEDDFLITSELLADIAGTEYDVTWVETGDAGIEALLENDHDVCLLDFRLGSLTGIDVLNAVKGGGFTPPCILLTGQDNERTDRDAADAGAADYLIKGRFTNADLERAIRYAARTARTNRSLAESEQRFRSVFAAANDGIALLDGDGLVLTANAAAHTMFGHAEHALIGTDFRSLLHEGDFEVLVARFSADGLPIDGGGSAAVTGRRIDGTEFPVECSIGGWEHDGARFWSAILRDVTDQRTLLDQLAHEAFHDQLTGLPNRAALRDRLDEAATTLDPGADAPVLLLIDLDDFKRINDVEGHEIGDQLLRLVARRLTSCIRPGETVTRIGGDEFALLIGGVRDPSGIKRIVERVLGKLREPFTIGSHFVTVTGSIGVAVLDLVGVDADEIIRNADMAMYAAKGAGKNRYEMFDSDMRGRMLDRVALEDDLRFAINSGQLSLKYQPIVDLQTNKTIGFEALARWRHGTRGWVPPLEFVGAAERSGMIIELGRFVLSRAIDQAALWQQMFTDRPPIGISVNLSSAQLNDSGLVAFVAELIDRSKLAPGTLTLEITESVMVGDVGHAVRVLGRLRDLGVNLAMDDFGTGYSSLSYLKRLPVDILKLDRTFVVDAVDERGRSLVEAVAEMSRALGLTTVAEGIETEEQRRLLTELGYDRGQGYLFAKPLPSDEASQHLRSADAHPRTGDNELGIKAHVSR